MGALLEVLPTEKRAFLCFLYSIMDINRSDRHLVRILPERFSASIVN